MRGKLRKSKIRANDVKWEDVKQAILDYAMENYPEEELRRAYPEYPYSLDGLSDELALKDLIDWFILERVQPSTGKTIAREFAEKPNVSPEVRERIIQMEDMRFGEFEVLGTGRETERGEFRVALRDSDNQLYEVLVPRKDVRKYRKGWTVLGRLHPWESSYRFAGVVRLKGPEPICLEPNLVDELMRLYERSEIQKAESIIVNPSSPLSSVLNKYPGHWVDGICSALGIETRGRKRNKIKEIAIVLNSRKLSEIVNGLPDRCKQALNFILARNGWVKYGQLSRKFDSEVGYWWNENPPKSTLGLLRLHGLFFVGRTGIGGRMHRITVVPAELREKLSQCAESTKSPL